MIFPLRFLFLTCLSFLTFGQTPTITSASYNAINNDLKVTGIDFVTVTGDANDIDASKISIIGQGGISYTLTDTADVELTSSTAFTLSLSATDRTYVEGLINKRGSNAVDGTAYSLSAAASFNGASSQEDTNNAISLELSFDKYVISTNVDSVESVAAADIDGDGYMDVLSASYGDDKVIWYKNDGGENFTPYEISTSADGANKVITADIDGDGDIDVLSSLFQDDSIIWYKNDGAGNFNDYYNLYYHANGAKSVAAADMDGDGDIDVLSASYYDDKIAWHEYDGTTGRYSVNVITTNADGAQSVATADMDGDGDIDVLSASYTDDKIAWYENDGNENFTTHTITTSADGPRSVAASDVDGDGDIDVLSATQGNSYITLYKNNGSQAFTAHTITSNGNASASVTSADLDGDGDIDVLSGSNNNNKMVWYKNDGSENFTSVLISTTTEKVYSVAVADLNADGNLDVLTASRDNDKVTWHEQISFDPKADSAIYDIYTGVLSVSHSNKGTGFVRLSDSTHDIDASQFSLTGEGGVSYTLTDTPDVDITDENNFSLTLSATDKATLDNLLNKIGTSSDDGTTYNLALASGFNGAGSAWDNINAVTVSDTSLSLMGQTSKVLTAYPIPTKDKLEIDLGVEQQGTAYLYDILGNELMRKEIKTHATLDTRDLPTGIYLLSIKTTETQQILKVIKE
jgi:hypothetical protein